MVSSWSVCAVTPRYRCEPEIALHRATLGVDDVLNLRLRNVFATFRRVFRQGRISGEMSSSARGTTLWTQGRDAVGEALRGRAERRVLCIDIPKKQWPSGTGSAERCDCVDARPKILNEVEIEVTQAVERASCGAQGY